MNSSDSLFMVCYVSFGSNCILKRSVHTSLDHKMETGYLKHNFGKRGYDYWKCTSELLKD